MKNVSRRLILTSLVLGFLILAFSFPASPGKVNAQWQEDPPLPTPCETTDFWGECLYSLDGRVHYSVDDYARCLDECVSNSNPAQCRQECLSRYHNNLDETQSLYNDCICPDSEEPEPWPVIDQSLSWCLEGCQQCDQIGTLLEQFVCRMNCQSFCFDNHPKPSGW